MRPAARESVQLRRRSGRDLAGKGQNPYASSYTPRNTFKERVDLENNLICCSISPLISVAKRHVDLIVMNKSHGEYRYIAVAVDVFSRTVVLQPLKSNNTLEIMKGVDAMFARKGVPETIWIDKEGAFTGPVVSDHLKKKGVKYVAFAYGQGSVFAENMIGQVRRVIVSKTGWDKGSEDQGWVKLLLKIEETFNSTKQSVTKVTPSVGKYFHISSPSSAGNTFPNRKR